MDAMTPMSALRPWIADVTLMRPDSALPLVHLPDAATALVCRRTGVRDGDLRVVGPRSRASYHPGKELPMCVRARLRPGAVRPVFGVPVSELRDRAWPPADPTTPMPCARPVPTVRAGTRSAPAALDGLSCRTARRKPRGTDDRDR